MSATLLLATDQELNNLTGSGIVVMVGCIGFVLALCGFCFWRLLRTEQAGERHAAPFEGSAPNNGGDRVRCSNPDCYALNDPHARFCYRCGGNLHENAE